MSLHQEVGIAAFEPINRGYDAVFSHQVALNLRFNRADIETTMRPIADDVLPQFAN